ncbi:hypothetical protein PAECIP111802_02457 [Paenibacillus allorhizosphaerae]|uniref:HTH rpiR-type domain-containing protein n=1 Tax=Paenibacillus allorhizosphaerae TaxID=2849866 RepID=A0ABM8VGH8_9BACL|nr:hypothetical protein PAECIP111802_02457 [Paenibacillus allorhizosphaerae]
MIQTPTLSAEQLKEMLNNVILSDACTPNNRKIAEYILVHYKSIAFMTASEIAEQVGVSQPAVTRFVTNSLGFQGFSHFLKVVQDIIRNEVTGVERYHISGKTKSNIELLIGQEIDNLNKLMEYTSEEKLIRAAERIASHKTIFIIGFRTGAPLASYFSFFLRKIHPDIRVCTSGGSEAYDMLHHLDRETTLVLPFIFPRYPREMIEVIQYMKQEKFQYLSVTDSYTLQVEGICDCEIVTPIVITAFTTLFDSYTSSFCILNILLDMIGRVQLDQTRDMLGSIEEMYQKNRVFYRK